MRCTQRMKIWPPLNLCFESRDILTDFQSLCIDEEQGCFCKLSKLLWHRRQSCFSCQCQQHHSYYLASAIIFIFLAFAPLPLLLKKGICHGQISLINLSFSTSIIIISTLSFHFLLLCYLINTLPFQYHESFGNPYASTVSFSSSAYTQICPWLSNNTRKIFLQTIQNMYNANSCWKLPYFFSERMFKRNISFLYANFKL